MGNESLDEHQAINEGGTETENVEQEKTLQEKGNTKEVENSPATNQGNVILDKGPQHKETDE